MLFLRKKSIKVNKNRGMTYVELIVVLSIFSMLTSVVIFNYGDFQAKVDIKNLASDIALKVVEAQKSSLSGLLPQAGAPYSTWKPSYGVYFNIATTPKQFIYFSDLSNPLNGYDATETLNTIFIQKSYYISSIDKCSAVPCASGNSTNILSVTFSRPSSSAVFRDSNGITTGFNYIQITIASPNNGPKALIKMYTSGRIQVN